MDVHCRKKEPPINCHRAALPKNYLEYPLPKMLFKMSCFCSDLEPAAGESRRRPHRKRRRTKAGKSAGRIVQ